MDDVGLPSHPLVAEHTAQDELDIKQSDGEQSERNQAGAAAIHRNPGLLLYPVSPRKQGNRDG